MDPLRSAGAVAAWAKATKSQYSHIEEEGWDIKGSISRDLMFCWTVSELGSNRGWPIRWVSEVPSFGREGGTTTDVDDVFAHLSMENKQRIDMEVACQGYLEIP